MALKYAILGDIHSNWEALSAVLADAESQGVSNFCSVGDMVGYNADPELCIEKVRELAGDAVVRGNHDHYCSRQENLNGFHPLAADVVDWTRKRLTDDQRSWLGNLRYSRTVETFMLVHATLDNPEMWGYVFDKLEAEASMAYQMCSVCFFGHTHVPLAFEKAGIVRGGLYTKLRITAGRKYYINVGSVGQPRDGDPRAAYAIYDMVQNVVELRRVPYDIPATQRKIQEAGLPARAASRLEIGR
ncbi:MAG: metallophosphoesterase family protein [Kiritimatiellia bacterium]|jgi:diadenosine tetraphosphatase ApaH/serine/threonine PP2A family protein phosphatase|nr:metallophosphoesterase family protein [Kiritimatiellia bacterium]